MTINQAGQVQVSVSSAQETQIVAAVPGIQGATGATGPTGPAGIPVVASGTVAAPAISFVSDPDTGINNNGPNQLALITGGQTALLVNASGVTAVGGDLTLSDGGAFTTTLQTITPTAARTISFPDATGTVALVAGSSGQLLYNNAGAVTGLSTVITDGNNITLGGRFISGLNGVASAPPGAFVGTWFTGGTSTTTKPQVLIEPTGTTSTAWSTSGTGLGVNAASAFTGRLLDLQVNGTTYLNVNSSGTIYSRANAAIPVLETLAGTFLRDYASYLISNQSIATVKQLGFAASAGADFDVQLNRDAAGTLAQRNGTAAQTYRVYNTFTDASNYERGFLRWSSNVFEVGPEAAGTGTARPMRITAATLKLPNLPTYADNAAALAGSLVAGDVYKTATGELRITV